jgi:hypothetical protein
VRFPHVLAYAPDPLSTPRVLNVFDDTLIVPPAILERRHHCELDVRVVFQRVQHVQRMRDLRVSIWRKLGIGCARCPQSPTPAPAHPNIQAGPDRQTRPRDLQGRSMNSKTLRGLSHSSLAPDLPEPCLTSYGVDELGPYHSGKPYRSGSDTRAWSGIGGRVAKAYK